MNDRAVAKLDRWGYFILAALILAYLFARAALVPFVHDEARTFQLYVVTGEFLPFRSHIDAGNHLLLTALAQISYKLFGMGMVSLRLWSLLGFVLFAGYAWCMGAWVRSSIVRWCMWGALLGMPFLLEFFALFRGYGLAMGFLMMALFHGSRFSLRGGTRELVATLGAMACATYASLSLMIMWCALLGACGAMSLLHRPTRNVLMAQLGCMLLFGLLPLAVAVLYSVQLSRSGALYFGSDEGLVHGTLASITVQVLGSGRWELLWPLVGVTGVALVSCVAAVRERDGLTKNILMLAAAYLLIADISGRVVLGEGFHVLYPTDRTAMQLIPLWLLLVACVVDRFARGRPMWRFAALPLLVFPARSAMTANVDRTNYWAEQAIPNAFFDLVAQRQHASERALIIGAYNQMPPCWQYGNMLRGGHLNELESTGWPDAPCDLLLIDTTFKDPPAGYRTIASASTGQNNLMERIEPLRTTLLFDTVFAQMIDTLEFVPMWETEAAPWRGHTLIVEMEAVISAPGLLKVRPVIDVNDVNGAQLHYSSFGAEERRVHWDNDTLHVARLMPFTDPQAKRGVAYLWNQARSACTIHRLHVRVFDVQP